MGHQQNFLADLDINKLPAHQKKDYYHVTDRDLVASPEAAHVLSANYTLV
jgi:hypothetical protein